MLLNHNSHGWGPACSWQGPCLLAVSFWKVVASLFSGFFNWVNPLMELSDGFRGSTRKCKRWGLLGGCDPWEWVLRDCVQSPAPSWLERCFSASCVSWDEQPPSLHSPITMVFPPCLGLKVMHPANTGQQPLKSWEKETFPPLSCYSHVFYHSTGKLPNKITLWNLYYFPHFTERKTWVQAIQ